MEHGFSRTRVRKSAATVLLVLNAVLLALVGHQASARAQQVYNCTRNCKCEFEGTNGGFCSTHGYGSKCTESKACRKPATE